MSLPCRFVPLVLAAFAALLPIGCSNRPRSAAVSPSRGAVSGAAGGFSFRDATPQSGITYRWTPLTKRPGNILDLIGNGCAFLDFDNDGNLDVLLVGTSPALYRGDGKGQFTRASLPALTGHFLGCATGDFNRDGFTDVYLTAHRGGALLQNDGGHGFKDVTTRSGVAPQPWGTASAFADLDDDGNLDLYVGNYVKFGPETVPQLCGQKGLKTACAPRQYPPEMPALYKGDGKGGFRDITRASGFDKVSGKALGVAIADYDDSGRLSVALANDETPGDLMKNLGGGKFKNIAKMSGTATDNDGNVHGGMGTDWGDVNNDGRLDLLVATYQNEPKNVYISDGADLFTDRSGALGLVSANPLVSFGTRLADFDNDGDLDMVLANGHVQDNIARIDARSTFLQPTTFYRGGAGGSFVNSTDTLDKAVTRPIMGRGLACGDYDNDGRLDLLVVDSQGAPLLLHNETEAAGHWIGIELAQPDGRSSLGATLTLKAGGKTYVRHCHSDGSYMSASDPRVLFGLGDQTQIDSLSVRWPGGGQDSYQNVVVDRYTRLTRGKPQ